jgi:hypothetical protein
MKFPGWAAVGWMVGGMAWVATGLIGLGATDGTGGFYAAEAAWLAVHLLILLGLVGMVRSDAVGGLAWGSRGFAAAIVGRIIFLVAELVAIVVGNGDLFLFPVAAVLTGVGMIVGGLAVVRAGRWKGALRFAPLAMGAYPFVAMFPVLAVTGERPDTMLACWGLMMLAVGLAMTRATMATGARSATGGLGLGGALLASDGP